MHVSICARAHTLTLLIETKCYDTLCYGKLKQVRVLLLFYKEGIPDAMGKQ